MTEFCKDASTDVRHHGEFWEKMRPLPPSSGRHKTTNSVLIENKTLLTQPQQIAETFNKLFHRSS